MRAKAVGILAVVTGAAVLGAAIAYSSRSAERVAESGSGEELFPNLSDRVNDVSRLVIEKGSDRLELERRGESWVIASKGGYPAKFETVKKTIMQVSELRSVEPKTARAELHSRIGVQDPGEGAESMRVSLDGAAGETLASVIVGQRTWQGGKSHVYVRKGGEPQSWLAEGTIDADASVLTWTDRELLRLDQSRIRSVTVIHPDGTSYTLSRPDSTQRNFTLENPPEGRSLTSESAGNPIATNLSYLGLSDVMASSEGTLDFTGAVEATYRTFDGLVVTVRTIETEDLKTWAEISASVELPEDAAGESAENPTEAEAPASAEAPAEAQPEGEAAEPEQPEAEPAAEGAAQNPEQPAVVAEAERLNEKLGGWWFLIEEWKAGSFRKRLDDILTPAPAVGGPEGPQPPSEPPSVLDLKPGGGG